MGHGHQSPPGLPAAELGWHSWQQQLPVSAGNASQGRLQIVAGTPSQLSAGTCARPFFLQSWLSQKRRFLPADGNRSQRVELGATQLQYVFANISENYNVPLQIHIKAKQIRKHYNFAITEYSF